MNVCDAVFFFYTRDVWVRLGGDGGEEMGKYVLKHVFDVFALGYERGVTGSKIG